MRAIILLFITPLFLLAAPVYAQLDANFAAQTNLNIVPEFPKPGEQATVSIENFSSQLYNSDIVWRLNGEVIGDANNRREMQYQVGKLGTTDVISATLIKPLGSTQTYVINVKPIFIDIVIEPQTRIPDFYQGRAVPSIGSQINATVLINNGSFLDGDYLYTWRLNNKVLENGPVRGTNQISFDMPRGSQSTLSVQVTDLNGNVLGRRAIYFKSVRPELVFYENNALYGQSRNAITDSLIMLGSASTVVAEPYYLDIRTYNNPDITEWEIDRTTQSNGNTNPYQITIQKVRTGGTSKVSFHVRSTSELLQGVEDNINIVF